MSKRTLSHLQINVSADNLPFYRDLFTLLNWQPIYADESMESFRSDDGLSLWFLGAANDSTNDRDGAGVNHIALAAGSQAEVDATVRHLEAKGVERLFDTPCHRPDFAQNDGDTYYQVMFESPDGILLEHVYIGPKQEG
ncbi:MAG: VOC family protein [Thermomicrobiales bacterium]|nr:VOC family protein [Thermomicrobiales bacterium]MCO5220507.1 VOC family protein [Thermomicrobiales bacterium]